MATPATIATNGQRSILARFLAAIEPAHGERLAGELLNEFQNIGRILAQTPEALERVLGSHRSIATTLLDAHEVVLAGLMADFATQPIDPGCPKLNQYLMASMGSLPEEVLRILFLDSARCLIADEQMQHGTIRQIEFHPRMIFRRAMEHNATAIILVHNHPSGDATPSENDIFVTRRLSDIGLPLDIEILDHIIVTATRARSVTDIEAVPVDRSPRSAHILRDSLGLRSGDRAENRSAALEHARNTYRRRRHRLKLIGSAKLFGEPAWDMLIDLFIHAREGKKVAVSALCLTSTAPPSTALRVVNNLCEAGLIFKMDDPNDGRRQFAELMPETKKRLEAYFCTAG